MPALGLHPKASKRRRWNSSVQAQAHVVVNQLALCMRDEVERCAIRTYLTGSRASFAAVHVSPCRRGPAIRRVRRLRRVVGRAWIERIGAARDALVVSDGGADG